MSDNASLIRSVEAHNAGECGAECGVTEPEPQVHVFFVQARTTPSKGDVIDAPAAEVMACEHLVSKARVAAVWARRRERPRPEDAASGVCGCCEMPCRANVQYCLVCSRKPYGAVTPRWPYGEQAQ